MSAIRVFFTSSAREFKKYKSLYLLIREIILKLNGQLTWDFVKTVDERIKNNVTFISNQEWHSIYTKMYNALLESDIAIFENSVSAFSTGFLTGLAISNQIPTLVLVKQGLEHTFKSSFTEGIISKYLNVAHFRSTNDIYKIIKEFIEVYQDNKPTEDFHLKISRHEKAFIRRLSNELGITKIDLIRKFIKDNMVNKSENK